MHYSARSLVVATIFLTVTARIQREKLRVKNPDFVSLKSIYLSGDSFWVEEVKVTQGKLCDSMSCIDPSKAVIIIRDGSVYLIPNEKKEEECAGISDTTCYQKLSQKISRREFCTGAAGIIANWRGMESVVGINSPREMRDWKFSHINSGNSYVNSWPTTSENEDKFSLTSSFNDIEGLDNVYLYLEENDLKNLDLGQTAMALISTVAAVQNGMDLSAWSYNADLINVAIPQTTFPVFAGNHLVNGCFFRRDQEVDGITYRGGTIHPLYFGNRSFLIPGCWGAYAIPLRSEKKRNAHVMLGWSDKVDELVSSVEALLVNKTYLDINFHRTNATAMSILFQEPTEETILKSVVSGVSASCERPQNGTVPMAIYSSLADFAKMKILKGDDVPDIGNGTVAHRSKRETEIRKTAEVTGISIDTKVGKTCRYGGIVSIAAAAADKCLSDEIEQTKSDLGNVNRKLGEVILNQERLKKAGFAHLNLTNNVIEITKENSHALRKTNAAVGSLINATVVVNDDLQSTKATMRALGTAINQKIDKNIESMQSAIVSVAKKAVTKDELRKVLNSTVRDQDRKSKALMSHIYKHITYNVRSLSDEDKKQVEAIKALAKETSKLQSELDQLLTVVPKIAVAVRSNKESVSSLENVTYERDLSLARRIRMSNIKMEKDLEGIRDDVSAGEFLQTGLRSADVDLLKAMRTVAMEVSDSNELRSDTHKFVEKLTGEKYVAAEAIPNGIIVYKEVEPFRKSEKTPLSQQLSEFEHYFPGIWTLLCQIDGEIKLSIVFNAVVNEFSDCYSVKGLFKIESGKLVPDIIKKEELTEEGEPQEESSSNDTLIRKKRQTTEPTMDELLSGATNGYVELSGVGEETGSMEVASDPDDFEAVIDAILMGGEYNPDTGEVQAPSGQSFSTALGQATDWLAASNEQVANTMEAILASEEFAAAVLEMYEEVENLSRGYLASTYVGNWVQTYHDVGAVMGIISFLVITTYIAVMAYKNRKKIIDEGKKIIAKGQRSTKVMPK